MDKRLKQPKIEYDRLILKKLTKQKYFKCEKAYKNDKGIDENVTIQQDIMLGIIFDYFIGNNGSG